MSEGMIAGSDGAKAPAPAPEDQKVAEPIGQRPSASSPAIGGADTSAIDEEVMAILARTQNECFAEMGYYPTLMHEFLELRKQNALLKNDNQKLYADNRSLAQFIQAQDQRIRVLTTPTDQQKHTLADLHESVRALTVQRDEIAGRLHAALNEVMLLRQELSRFVPSALVVSPVQGHPLHAQQQQRTAGRPGAQLMVVEQSPNLVQYQRQASAQHIPQSKHRPIQPLPAHRSSQPNVMVLSAADAPPAIAHLRRTSAPAPLAIPTIPANSAGPSSASASPLSTFTGLSLASPATPMSSRPPTANGSASAPPGGFAVPQGHPGPPRNIHMKPVHTSRSPSSSSLAGAMIDLTADDDQMQEAARKKRKTEHIVDTGSAPPSRPSSSQNVSPVTLSDAPVANGHVPSPQPSGLPAHPPESMPAPQPTVMHAPQPSPGTSHAIVPVQQQQQPIVAETLTNSPAQQPPMSDVDMDQESTLEEDCLDATFEDDDDDENKLWCKMCRSRFEKGHTTQPPRAFVGASQQELIAHCETVHPHGWKILKDKVAEQRAKDADEPV
ncbi:hypothetical protein GY45DRAFT_1317034 [Cubamyces sp. BRFM 1775]|nr:hypothetical protein GY45DRAFT_1317034 [Cubamyces sp. BRFM 1775]